MGKRFKILTLLLFFLSLVTFSFAQKKDEKQKKSLSKLYSGLEFRNIGPAFMSGRIVDIAINPENKNIWYVAVGSGGVWKTENRGTTWKPVFDKQKSYSIGCVTIDKNDPHTIWVGTGENVGGRHVGFGDGIYKSEDDGKTWKNMGLRKSEHISKIIVHPNNSNIVWVAVQGPLWSKGGERGFYKTIDGGKTWKKTLGDDEWTGVTDIDIDPKNPNVIYAATWQRHPLKGAADYKDVAMFWKELSVFRGDLSTLRIKFNKIKKIADAMEIAVGRAEILDTSLIQEISKFKQDVLKTEIKVFGSYAKNEVGEHNPPSISDRLSVVMSGIRNSTYGPTGTHLKTFNIAKKEYKTFKGIIDNYFEKIKKLNSKLKELNAPDIEEIDF